MYPRVLVLHTGGTIGMCRSPDGYRPMAGFGERLAEMLHVRTLPAFDFLEIEEPIDSANLQPAHWSRIARELLKRWDDYAGFVVLHGTDTMAWSASALSFMLRGADKPVILTGAQIPLVEPRSDALGNLEAALLLAAGGQVKEVCICFGRHLLRGNRSSKMASMDFDAFGSPNCLPLADIGIDIELHRERLLPAAARAFRVPELGADAVAVITLHPGISARIVQPVLADAAVRGVILCSYGVGNAPDADQQLMAVLKAAVARGVVIVNTTQCVTGRVAQGAYATGATLSRVGVTPGADMTLESAFAKLHFLLATEPDADAVRLRLGQSLCGELS